MRALSEFISSTERLFSNLKLSLKSLKDDNAISFNLVLQQFSSSVVIDKSMVPLYDSSNFIIKLEYSICLGGIAKQSPLERRSLSLDDNF